MCGILFVNQDCFGIVLILFNGIERKHKAIDNGLHFSNILCRTSPFQTDPPPSRRPGRQRSMKQLPPSCRSTKKAPKSMGPNSLYPIVVADPKEAAKYIPLGTTTKRENMEKRENEKYGWVQSRDRRANKMQKPVGQCPVLVLSEFILTIGGRPCKCCKTVFGGNLLSTMIFRKTSKHRKHNHITPCIILRTILCPVLSLLLRNYIHNKIDFGLSPKKLYFFCGKKTSFGVTTSVFKQS